MDNLKGSSTYISVDHTCILSVMICGVIKLFTRCIELECCSCSSDMYTCC